MRLHAKKTAPSAIKVQIFVDECGKDLEMVDVPDTRAPDFLGINPFGTVPVLETDDGQFLSESLTICHYLHKRWRSHLFGEDASSQLEVEMWERRAELLLFLPAIEYVHQTHPIFAGDGEQNSKWARTIVERTARMLDPFEGRLTTSAYIAGESFSIADITAFLGLGAFAAFRAIDLAPLPAIRRWHEDIANRASMERLRELRI